MPGGSTGTCTGMHLKGHVRTMDTLAPVGCCQAHQLCCSVLGGPTTTPLAAVLFVWWEALAAGRRCKLATCSKCCWRVCQLMMAELRPQLLLSQVWPGCMPCTCTRERSRASRSRNQAEDNAIGTRHCLLGYRGPFWAPLLVLAALGCNVRLPRPILKIHQNLCCQS